LDSVLTIPGNFYC